MVSGKRGLGFLIAGAALGTVAVQRSRFASQVEDEVQALFGQMADTKPHVVSSEDIAALPEPVQRWLVHAGAVDRLRPRSVRLKQEGEFRLRPKQGWMPFTAEQYFTIDPPGFVWTVSLRMFPGITVTGRDRYADGEASIHMRALSLVPVADSRGGDLNQGALLRYLGEIVWFPTAALEPYIRWEEVDEHSARATISVGGVTAPATFEFGPDGQPLRVTAMRANDATGRLEPWTAITSREDIFQGSTLPSEGEVTWNYEDGDFTYIRWRVTEIEYDRPMLFRFG